MERQVLPIEMPQVTAVLTSIAGQLNFRAIIQAVSAAIRVRLPHDHLDIALTSADGQSVTAWETGLHTEWDAETTATKSVDVSPIRDLFRGKVDHIITSDAQTDPRFHFEGAFSKPIFAVGLRSRLHVPLKVEGRVFGALSFSTQEIGTYRQGDIGNARIVADTLSGYIYALRQADLARQIAVRQAETEARADGLRQGARQLAEALEDERRSIGMDLHDQTVADLSRISRNVHRLADRGSAGAGELATLEDDINHCLRELRVIVDHARPSVLELFGFAEAVEALMDRAAGQSARQANGRIACRVVDTSGGLVDRLPEQTQIALYRIVQEALNNAFRHSGATEVAVILQAETGAGQNALAGSILIQDNGMGLSADRRRAGAGLANMRTRAALIDVGFRVSTSAQGTEIGLDIPVARATGQGADR